MSPARAALQLPVPQHPQEMPTGFAGGRVWCPRPGLAPAGRPLIPGQEDPGRLVAPAHLAPCACGTWPWKGLLCYLLPGSQRQSEPWARQARPVTLASVSPSGLVGALRTPRRSCSTDSLPASCGRMCTRRRCVGLHPSQLACSPAPLTPADPTCSHPLISAHTPIHMRRLSRIAAACFLHIWFSAFCSLWDPRAPGPGLCWQRGSQTQEGGP